MADPPHRRRCAAVRAARPAAPSCRGAGYSRSAAFGREIRPRLARSAAALSARHDRAQPASRCHVGRRRPAPASGSTGDIVALRLRNVGLKSLAELPELETLASLRELDLSNNPLSGVIDVALPGSRSAGAAHTRITGIHGLSRLTSLWSLELRGTQLTALADLRSWTASETSRTRSLGKPDPR